MINQKPIGGAVLLSVLLSAACVWLLPDSHADDKPAPKAETKIVTNSIGMKLVLIPAGKFMMGSPESEKGRVKHEGPQHEVEITKPFYMGAYEVTQEEHEQVMGSNPSKYKNKKNPVEMVSWDDAVAFCKKLSEMPKEKAAGRSYRLPTEAEWEYACRAGSSKAYCFGDDTEQLKEYAWFTGNADGKTHPVGTRKANAFGLYDMHGNVYEWCESSVASSRVLRGGCWVYAGGFCRSANRVWDSPDRRSSLLGFRVAAVQSR